MRFVFFILLLVSCSGRSKEVFSSKRDLLDLLRDPKKFDTIGSNYRKNELYQMHVSNFPSSLKFRGVSDTVPIGLWAPKIKEILKDAKEFQVPIVVFGSSNAWNLTDDLRSALMLGGQFGGVANVSVPGSTAEDWNMLVEEHPDIYLLLSSFKYQVTAIGGNHVLKDDMKDSYQQLLSFHQKFPRSLIINVPLYEGKARDNIHSVNFQILQIWDEERIIDSYSDSINKRNEGTPIYVDGIHFLDSYDLLYRIPMIQEKLLIYRMKSGAAVFP